MYQIMIVYSYGGVYQVYDTLLQEDQIPSVIQQWMAQYHVVQITVTEAS